MAKLDEQQCNKTNLLGSRQSKTYPKWKTDYAAKLKQLFDEYDSFLIITIDNVSSQQINEMRKDFRGRVRFLFGRNTLIRKIIKMYIIETGQKHFMSLLEAIQGNCGLAFTKESLSLIKQEIRARIKQCAAKAGSISPVDIFVPAGPTGMEPSNTNIEFLQRLDIPFRMNRGQLDIEEEIHLIEKGTKVVSSHAQLLRMLGIKPFYYGVEVEWFWERGTILRAHGFDCYCSYCGGYPRELLPSFTRGIRNVSAFCMTVKHATIANVPFSLINAYRKVCALGLTLDEYSWCINGLNEIRKNRFMQSIKSYQPMRGTVTFELVRTTIKCKQHTDDIEQYTHTFWNWSTYRNAGINANIKDMKNFHTNSDQQMILHSNRNDMCREHSIIMSMECGLNNADAQIKIIEVVCKLLTGNRKEDVSEYLLCGYLRLSPLPLEIHNVCARFVGSIKDDENLFVKPMFLYWDNNAVMTLKRSFIEIINIQNVKICSQCLLTRGYNHTLQDDQWYLWWFLRNENQPENKLDCIIIQIGHRDNKRYNYNPEYNWS
eukprot:513654_1